MTIGYCALFDVAHAKPWTEGFLQVCTDIGRRAIKSTPVLYRRAVDAFSEFTCCSSVWALSLPRGRTIMAEKDEEKILISRPISWYLSALIYGIFLEIQFSHF